MSALMSWADSLVSGVGLSLLSVGVGWLAGVSWELSSRESIVAWRTLRWCLFWNWVGSGRGLGVLVGDSVGGVGAWTPRCLSAQVCGQSGWMCLRRLQ